MAVPVDDDSPMLSPTCADTDATVPGIGARSTVASSAARALAGVAVGVGVGFWIVASRSCASTSVACACEIPTCALLESSRASSFPPGDVKRAAEDLAKK